MSDRCAIGCSAGAPDPPPSLPAAFLRAATLLAAQHQSSIPAGPRAAASAICRARVLAGGAALRRAGPASAAPGVGTGPARAASMTTISLSLDTPELAQAYEHGSDRQFNHGKLLIETLGVRRGQRVLDVGAGTGRLAAHVAEIVGPEGSVTAIDPLPLRVDIARQKARANLATAVGRAEDLSAFASKSFDVVYLNSVLHWLNEAQKERAIAEATRVLKPGGKLGFSTGSREKPHQLEPIQRKVLAELGRDAQDNRPHKLTVDEVRALLERAGFIADTVEILTFVDHAADVDEILRHSGSSSFGNHLSHLSPEEKREVRARLAKEIEAFRTPQGIRLERNLIFAIAHTAGN
ncbi:methyltransferase domain-containing protein [Sorangium sp. So ce448]|uniref:class I SAM-dependent methyltransferase n=1 Tax=Sorangium sp. So ce448 TaxID=3133314 RepID=UPI003F5E312E